MTQARNVLLALSTDLQTAEELSHVTQLPLESVRTALEQLTAQGLAIPEEGTYEVTGPLSWFGTFDAARRYFARRGMHAQAREGAVHLYLIDIRVKDGRPAGDPLTETVAVFACGATSSDVRSTLDALNCEDCRVYPIA